jgi:hypothetical protein
VPPPISHVQKRFPSLWHKLTQPFHTYPAEKPEISPELHRVVLNLLELEIRGIEELMDTQFQSWREVTT